VIILLKLAVAYVSYNINCPRVYLGWYKSVSVIIMQAEMLAIQSEVLFEDYFDQLLLSSIFKYAVILDISCHKTEAFYL